MDEPRLEPRDPDQQNSTSVPYRLLVGSTTLATISLRRRPIAGWSLPRWLVPSTADSWQALAQALPQAMAQAGLPAATAWSRATHTSTEPPFRWLQAATTRIDAPLPFETALPSATDALALADLIHAAAPGPIVGPTVTRGTTIDTTLALFAGRWGAVLEACSCLATGRGRLMGGIITTLDGDTPLIAALAAPSDFVARELLLTVLDALFDFRYSQVNLLLSPTSSLLPLALAVGFSGQAELVQTSLSGLV